MRALSLTALTALAAALTFAAPPPDLAKLDAYIEKSRAEWEVPGLAVAIVKDGKVVLAKGYGVKELGKADKVDADTLFAIASNTKAFTATAIALLQEQKKVALDDRVAEVLPGFTMYDAWVTHEMRVEDLLCHRSGLKTFSGDLLWYGTPYTRTEILRRAQYLKPAFGFRNGYGYSNLMFLAAGEVIAARSAQTWDAFIHDSLLAPLGMTRSITTVRELDAKGNYATPHTSFEGPVATIGWVNWDTMAPAGGVISSANDMARWLLMNLQGGEIDGKRILSESSIRTLWKPRNVNAGPAPTKEPIDRHFATYALGWSVGDYKGRYTVGHGGAYDGMFSQTFMMPEERLGIVVLTNCDRGVIGPIVNRIRDAYLGLEEQDYSTKALASFKAMKKTKSEPAKVDNARAARKLDDYAGTYVSTMYGDATVDVDGAKLVLKLLPNPNLVADLTPLDADTFTLTWRKKFAFFAGGRAQFVATPAGKVSELRLDVPNNDFWFDELELKRK